MPVQPAKLKWQIIHIFICTENFCKSAVSYVYSLLQVPYLSFLMFGTLKDTLMVGKGEKVNPYSAGAQTVPHI